MKTWDEQKKLRLLFTYIQYDLIKITKTMQTPVLHAIISRCVLIIQANATQISKFRLFDKLFLFLVLQW